MQPSEELPDLQWALLLELKKASQMIKKYGFLLILVFIYLIGFVIGLVSGMNEIHTTNTPINNAHTISLLDLPIHERFLEIFKNNIIVSFKNMVFGALSFGFFSVLYTFYNGFFFGFVTGISFHFLTISEILKSTLPHSFELFGIALFGYIGFLFSVYLFTRRIFVEMKIVLTLFILGTIIILMAAIVENYVSMSIC